MRFESFRNSAGAVGGGGYCLDGEPIGMVESHKDLGVLIDTSLKFHRHIRSITNKAAALSNNLLRTTLCRDPDFMKTLFIAHIRPHLEFCSSLWNTGYIGDLRLLESVQRRWTREVDGMEEKSYGERLLAMDLYSVKGRLLRADLIRCWKIFNGKCVIAPSDLFEMSPHPGTRGHIFKVMHIRCRLDSRKRSYAIRIAPVWNSLPEGLVLSDSVDIFKRGLHSVINAKLFDYFE